MIRDRLLIIRVLTDCVMCVSRKWRGYTVVLGGVLIHLTLGTIYTFGRLTFSLHVYFRVACQIMKTERPSVESGRLHSEVCRNILLQNVILWIALIYALTSLFHNVHHSEILVHYIRFISLFAKLYGNYLHFPLNSKQQNFDDHVIKIWAKFCKSMYICK